MSNQILKILNFGLCQFLNLFLLGSESIYFKTWNIHGVYPGIWILFADFYYLIFKKLNFSNFSGPSLFDFVKVEEITQFQWFFT